MGRRRIHIDLTDDAIDGLDALLGRHNVTRTAFVEALGRLGQRTDPTVVQVVAEARRIDRERRSRR